MLGAAKAFSGFSVDDVPTAAKFYRDTLGLSVEAGDDLRLNLGSGATVFVYPKDNHVPAEFTVLNFPVPDIEAAARELTAKGVTFERYFDDQDAQGIYRGEGSPLIAWFKDPAGNVLSIIQE